jgi:hypothetical protein
MAIKFTCPHCQKPLSVKDQLAGKKGNCPFCKKVLTVPKPAAATAGPAAPAAPAEAAAPPPADMENEAASLLADQPAPEEQAEAKTVDFNCPYCDEELHLSADLAGKKAPCPECRRIIPVPQLVKKEPKDWRKADPRRLGARPPDAPEDAWDAGAMTRASQQGLVEAGVIPKVRPRLTLQQKITRGVLAAAAVVVVAVGGIMTYRWLALGKEQLALKDALAYADSEPALKAVGPEGVAALHSGAAQYYLGAHSPQGIIEARNHFNQALKLLSSAPDGTEREAALVELAEAQVALGSSNPDEVRQGARLSWKDTSAALRTTLAAMKVHEARLEALRKVSRRLVDAGQPGQVLALTSLVYSAPGADKAEALAVAGLALLGKGKAADAGKAADRALEEYARGGVQLRAPVVALAVALKRQPPKPDKGSSDQEADAVGQAGGLARLGQWDQAREKALAAPKAPAQLQALVEVAAAAVDAKAGNTAALDAAVQLAAGDLKGRVDNGWLVWRLVRLGVRAGLDGDKLKGAVDGLPAQEKALRGRAQLEILRGRLAAKQPVDEGVLQQVDEQTLSARLAREELARHNVAYDEGLAKTVQKWEDPDRAFGSLGVALGLQQGR